MKNIILNYEQKQNFAVAYAKLFCVDAVDLTSIREFIKKGLKTEDVHGADDAGILAEKIMRAFGTPAQQQRFYTLNK